MLKFKLNTNLQTFNKNIASLEKSPIFTSHKSYTNPLPLMKTSILTTLFIYIFCLKRTNFNYRNDPG